MPITPERRERKRREIARTRGLPCNVFPHEMEKAVATLRAFHDEGMGYTQLARQMGTEKSTIQKILTGTSRGPAKSMRRATYDAIMRLHFEAPVAPGKHRRGGAKVSPLPGRRKLQALMRAGYPGNWLAAYLGMDKRNLSRFMINDGTAFCYAVTDREVDEMYRKLIDTDPEDVGVARQSAVRARSGALGRGYAPASSWDDDTINDPDASPEYTGMCGTQEGWISHHLFEIPMCQSCEGAVTFYQSRHRERLGEVQNRYEFYPDNVVAAMNRRQLSGNALEMEMGLTKGITNRWLNSEQHNPSWKSGLKLAAFLDLSWTDIFKLKESS